MADYSKNLGWQMCFPEIELSCNLDYDPTSVSLFPPLSEYARSLPFYVQEVGHTVAGEQYYVNRKNLESFMAGVILDGGVTMNYNGCTIDTVKGSLIWLDCRLPHTFRILAAANHVDCFFVHFWGSGAKQYYELFRTLAPNGCVQVTDSDPFLRHIHRLFQLYSASNHTAMTELTACSCLSDLCLMLLEHAQSTSMAAPPDYIVRARQLLEQNYTRQLTLPELAQALFVSPAWLQKQFKYYFGCSPNEYLLQLRLGQAKVLLRSTGQSVNDISFAIGFNTPSYFIRVFSKYEGMTPLAYRKMWSSS